MTATIDLLKLQAVFGVFLFEDANKLQYFSFISDGSNVIGCPDGMNAFEQIEVTEQLVICKTLDETYRIYIRNQKEWLTDIHYSIDFCGPKPVHTITKEFIQVSSVDSINIGWPIYLLEEKRWIPSTSPHVNKGWKAGLFKTTIKQITFHEKKALLLQYGESYNRYQLYIIYFIKEDVFFSIPTPEKFHRASEESKSMCTFRFISESHAIIYFETPSMFELYDITQTKFLKFSEYVDINTVSDSHKNHMDSAYRLIDIAFNEENLALRIQRGLSHESIMEWYVFEFKKNLQQVTATLEPAPVTRSYFDNVKIDENGKLEISFIINQSLSKTL